MRHDDHPRVTRTLGGPSTRSSKSLSTRISSCRRYFITCLEKFRFEGDQNDDDDDDDDDEYQRQASNYRVNATAMLSYPFFLASVLISLRVKKPVTRYFVCTQKQLEIDAKSTKEAMNAGKAYLGPTLLSLLVHYNAQTVAADISELLSDEALASPSAFGPVWEIDPCVRANQ